MARWMAVLAVWLVVCARTLGQGGAVGPGPYFDPFQRPVMLAEARRLAEDAGLGKEGAAAAMELVRGANSVLERLGARMDRALEKPNLEGRMDAAAYYGRVAERLRAHERVAGALLADLRQLVPAGKESAWESFERRRHRRMYLPVTERRGPNVDLVAILESAKLDGDPAVREALGRYEEELDALLLKRIAALPAFIRESTEPPEDGGEAERARAFEPMREADCAILHLHRAAAERVAKALPEEERAGFNAAWVRARTWYARRSRARDRAEGLLRSAQMDPGARDALRAAVERYDRAVASRCAQWVTAQEDLDCSANREEWERGTWRSAERKQVLEAVRPLELELYNAVEKAASPEELDAVDLEVMKGEARE